MGVKVDGKGERKDDGKPRPDLFPPDALLLLAALYWRGAFKYDSRNWERGMPYSKILSPLMRHTLYYMCGEDRDPETRVHHMIVVAWNALAVASYDIRGLKKFDDRNKVNVATLRAMLAEIEKSAPKPKPKRRKK